MICWKLISSKLCSWRQLIKYQRTGCQSQAKWPEVYCTNHGEESEVYEKPIPLGEESSSRCKHQHRPPNKNIKKPSKSQQYHIPGESHSPLYNKTTACIIFKCLLRQQCPVRTESNGPFETIFAKPQELLVFNTRIALVNLLHLPSAPAIKPICILLMFEVIKTTPLQQLIEMLRTGSIKTR